MRLRIPLIIICICVKGVKCHSISPIGIARGDGQDSSGLRGCLSQTQRALCGIGLSRKGYRLAFNAVAFGLHGDRPWRLG